MKRTNSLPLSPVVLTRRYCRENCYLQLLRSTVALNSYLGFSALCKKLHLAKMLQVLTSDLSLPCRERETSDAQEKLLTGQGVCKDFCVKKKKNEWEMEGSLSARWMTQLVSVQRYDHVGRSDLRKNFAKDAKIFQRS